jgi:hypothetical protein
LCASSRPVMQSASNRCGQTRFAIFARRSVGVPIAGSRLRASFEWEEV